MRDGPAEGRVEELLTPFADQIPEGALEGYALPVSDGTQRNRRNLRRAMGLLADAGWEAADDGVLRNADGQPFRFNLLLRQGATELQTIADIYLKALERLGIQVNVEVVDNAAYQLRITNFDFDMTDIRRQFSLSPGNDQRLYWGSAAAEATGSRNLMGVASPAIDAMIDAMVNSYSDEDFTAATRALDRLLTAGRYVIPIHSFDVGRIAHVSNITYDTENTPLYGDSVYFLPEVWWIEPD